MAIGTMERPVNFSPRMSCPTLPDGRWRKTAGGGDHVDRRCAWGATRNRAYLPRLPALTRRALPDFAEPYLSRIRIAGNKAASSRSLTSAAGCLRLPLPKTRGIERAPRDHSPTGDRREKRLLRHFYPSLGIFDPRKMPPKPRFFGWFSAKTPLGVKE